MNIPSAKCPSCGKLVTNVHFEEVNAEPGFFSQGGWRSIVYLCPNLQCRAVLSVQIDPIAIRTEICDHIDKEVSSLRNEVNRLGTIVAHLAQSMR